MNFLSAVATDTEMILIVTLFFSAFFSLFAYIIISAIFENRRQVKRVADYRLQAKLMGLQFIENPDGEAYHQFDSFKLFSRGKKRRVSNLVEGDSGDVKISIFDYKFMTGSKNSMLHRQTVIALRSDHLRFPEFSMRPEIFLDKLGPALGLQNLDFDTHPEFSKRFVLEGSDEAAIRSFFTPVVLEFFENNPYHSLEAHNDTMFFYRENKLRKVEELKDQLAQAYEAFNVFKEANARHGNSRLVDQL